MKAFLGIPLFWGSMFLFAWVIANFAYYLELLMAAGCVFLVVYSIVWRFTK